jgi:hypothetical protein
MICLLFGVDTWLRDLHHYYIVYIKALGDALSSAALGFWDGPARTPVITAAFESHGGNRSQCRAGN